MWFTLNALNKTPISCQPSKSKCISMSSVHWATKSTPTYRLEGCSFLFLTIFFISSLTCVSSHLYSSLICFSYVRHLQQWANLFDSSFDLQATKCVVLYTDGIWECSRSIPDGSMCFFSKLRLHISIFFFCLCGCLPRCHRENESQSVAILFIFLSFFLVWLIKFVRIFFCQT